MNKPLFIVIFIGYLSACGITPEMKNSVSACEQESTDQAKYECYLADLRFAVHGQVRDEIRDWLEFSPAASVHIPINEAKLEIVLTAQGKVQDAIVVQSSGNLSLDNTLVQAIRNAGPFQLPKDEKIRKHLLHFTFNLLL